MGILYPRQLCQQQMTIENNKHNETCCQFWQLEKWMKQLLKEVIAKILGVPNHSDGQHNSDVTLMNANMKSSQK